MALTTHLLPPRLHKEYSCTSIPRLRLCGLFQRELPLPCMYHEGTFKDASSANDVRVSVPVRHLSLSNRKPKIIPTRSQYSYFIFYEKLSNKCCVLLGGGLPFIISEPDVSRGQCRSRLTSSRAIITVLTVRNRKL